ncbi:MAG: nitroreductase family deazaflavin-dependent oxidoreductase [Chloroflexi bacterium]|nr:MAG: nitroreductase family deazaflavin-dependent oxidoreductase [Chloroflexota bacterium]TMB93511.1 MAG: nitroreductase family deazaflavin-dependent oxidoreductase [Chloroflexota bacterium]TMC30156.1 MAG: nitroreductase family deazaflavin-dependent oxidoreductase [Chloroflexota bacterium]TMC31900.1 MAG: nitroreductase family deazaflavin-dependent oxidoreductase [Chloroflexota bacterium]TMC57972.1 MAG: nitroreductase family deazaflavin-dependent oxidoreductase [Chloroflexota bacterium]
MASVLKAATHVFNPLAMPIASSGLIPVWGVIRHRGRKSGRAFATPVALAATRDGFVVPLPWGDRTDWCRNVFAARGGAIRYRGREYAIGDPEVVSVDVARPAFPAPIRAVLPLTGIKRFLRVRRIT